MLSSISYLHTNLICHRDIKLDNFLLYKKNDISIIKLIDFGICKKLSSQSEKMEETIGSLDFVAPGGVGFFCMRRTVAGRSDHEHRWCSPLS